MLRILLSPSVYAKKQQVVVTGIVTNMRGEDTKTAWQRYSYNTRNLAWVKMQRRWCPGSQHPVRKSQRKRLGGAVC